jgi:hypothetical protein
MKTHEYIEPDLFIYHYVIKEILINIYLTRLAVEMYVYIDIYE